MKALYCLLFALLASQSSLCLSEKEFCVKVEPKKAEDCHNAGLEGDGLKIFRCCYIDASLTLPQEKKKRIQKFVIQLQRLCLMK